MKIIEKIMEAVTLGLAFGAILFLVIYGALYAKDMDSNHDTACDQYISRSSIRQNSRGRFAFVAFFPDEITAEHCTTDYVHDDWHIIRRQQWENRSIEVDFVK